MLAGWSMVRLCNVVAVAQCATEELSYNICKNDPVHKQLMLIFNAELVHSHTLNCYMYAYNIIAHVQATSIGYFPGKLPSPQSYYTNTTASRCWALLSKSVNNAVPTASGLAVHSVWKQSEPV